MDKPFETVMFCLTGYVQSPLHVDGIERLLTLLYVQADNINRRLRASNRSPHSGFIAHVCLDLFYVVGGFDDRMPDGDAHSHPCLD